MTDALQATPATPSKLPAGMIAVVACCFLRGLMNLWFIGQMARYISSGSFGVYRYLALSVIETLIWVALGTGLMRLKPRARVCAMIFCGVILAWSSYLFLNALFHRATEHWNFPLFGFNIVSDFAIIAYLAQTSVKNLFVGKKT